MSSNKRFNITFFGPGDEKANSVLYDGPDADAARQHLREQLGVEIDDTTGRVTGDPSVRRVQIEEE